MRYQRPCPWHLLISATKHYLVHNNCQRHVCKIKALKQKMRRILIHVCNINLPSDLSFLFMYTYLNSQWPIGRYWWRCTTKKLLSFWHIFQMWIRIIIKTMEWISNISINIFISFDNSFSLLCLSFLVSEKGIIPSNSKICRRGETAEDEGNENRRRTVLARLLWRPWCHGNDIGAAQAFP